MKMKAIWFFMLALLSLDSLHSFSVEMMQFHNFHAVLRRSYSARISGNMQHDRLSLAADRRPLVVCSATVSSSNTGADHTDLKYGGLQHAGVLVSDTKSAVKFYTEVLGMSDVSHLRPALEYPGAFIACGSHQIHLMELPSLDPREGRPIHGGRDRHIAVTIANLDPLSRRLTNNGVPFTMSKSGRRALFCRDRDSNAIEFVEDSTI